jgi:hypothetical protein
MRAVVHKRPVVLAAVKDLGGSGFPGGLGALQYTKNSHKPESSLKKILGYPNGKPDIVHRPV